jgi:capsular exopolysaccharide synthesis family protein
VSKIFEALNEAGKDKSKSEPPKVSWRAKVGPPKMAVDLNLPDSSVEAYNLLRQQITDLLPSTSSRMLMFVSPSGVGESTAVVVGFGYTVTWIGESAILVDANRSDPVLHRILGTDQEPGVTELASGRATVEEVVRDTGMRKLRIVPAGAQPPGPYSRDENAVLIDSLNALRTSADWIIFNAPPVSEVNDFEALSRVVDGVVLVIRAEKTRWEAALNTKEQLQKAGANIIGAILTGRKNHIPAWLNRWL